MNAIDTSFLRNLAAGLLLVSLAVTAVMLIGSALWQEQAQKYKNNLQNVLFGAILLAISSGLATLMLSQ
jgi:hypothetical protein